MRKCFKIILLLLFFSAVAQAQNCTINAGVPKTICVGRTFDLDGSTGGPLNSTLAWSVVSQPAGSNVIIANPNSLSPNAGAASVPGTYVFRIGVQCGDGVFISNDVTITVNSVPGIPTQTGLTNYTCYTGAPIDLVGTSPQTGESVSWSVGSDAGTFSTPSSNITTFTPKFPLNECSNSFTVVIYYEVKNGSGCIQSTSKEYTFSRQYSFYAEADPTPVCGSFTNLKGSCPGNGTALWSLVSAPAGAPAPIFSSSSSRNSKVSNLVPGNYVFNYAVNGSCGNNTMDVPVVVVNGTGVSIADAGPNQLFCGAPGTISLNGNAPATGETVMWSLLNGGTSVVIADPSNRNTIVSGLTKAGAPYHFLYRKISAGGCSTKDTMAVYVEPELTLTNTNATICTSTNLASTEFETGEQNRVAKFGFFGYNELDTVMVTTTYISGPAPTISNATSVGNSIMNSLSGGSQRVPIALGQSVSAKLYNTGNTNAPNQLYPPIIGTTNIPRDSYQYYLVNTSHYTTVGTYKYRVAYTTRCSTYVEEITVVRGTSIAVNAGTDVYLNCGATTATLAGSVIDDFASWQTISMPAGATNPINGTNHGMRNPPLTGLINGTYIFGYANNAGESCIQNTDDVKIVVSNVAPPVPSAGTDQTVCAGSFTLNGSAIPGTALGQWSVVSPSGAAVTFSNATVANPTVSGLLPSTSYIFRYTLTNGCGSNSDDVVIITNANTGPAKPVVTVNTATCLLGNQGSFPRSESANITHTELTGSNTGVLSVVAVPASSLTSWSQTGSTSTTKTIELNLSGEAAISFIWTESSATCAAQTASDTATVFYMATNTIGYSAGPDQNLCSVTAFPYVANLSGTPTDLVKSWNLAYASNGQNVNFGSSISANTSVTLPAAGTYKFEYKSVSADANCALKDYVTIVAAEPGSLAQAGPNVDICNATGTFNLAATPLAVGTGVWEVVDVINGTVPTITNVNSATSSITFNRSGTVVLRWSSYGSDFSCGASSSDLVTVTYIAPARAGSDINLCNSTSINLNAVSPSPASGVWSQMGGPNAATFGSYTNPGTLISGLISGSYTFRWTVNGACTTTDDVVVKVNNMTTAANAGADFSVCNGSSNGNLLLNATAATGGLAGTWAVTSFPAGASAGTFSNPNDANATYTGATVAGNYIFSWTLSNGSCSTSDFVAVTVDPASCVTISGTVFDDANGNTRIDGTDASLSIPANMYVYLVNASGIIVDVVSLGSNATYSFGASPNTSYTIELSTISYPLGTNVNTTPIDNTPPTDWVTTGENGAGNVGNGDAMPNGELSVSTGTTGATQQNFGIEKKPVVYAGVDADRPNPGGTSTSPVASTLFTGDDKEDGIYPNNLTGKEVTLSPATNGTMYYDSNPVTGVLVITNFDPTKVSIDPDASGATTGLTGANPDPTFTYTVKDAAGVESDPKTIRVPFSSSLPVRLVSFTANKVEQTSQLTWATTEESNSDHFEVQHSNDATKWTVAGKVAASGESKAVKNYAFTHSASVSGVNYYRLKMIDKDATFAYSRIASVHFDDEIKISVYPNPVSSVLSIKNDNGQVIKSIEILDITGKSVYFNNSKTGLSDLSLKSINLQHVPDGAYVVRTIGMNNVVSTSKIIVVH